MNKYDIVNGTVRCTKSVTDIFTVGKCYEVKNKCITADDGFPFDPISCRNAVEWLEDNGVKFEFVKDYDTKIERVIFNDPATIILWNDGTKTVAKCCDGDKYDAEKGFCIAYLKKMLGTGKFSEELHKWVKDEKPYKTKPPFTVEDKVKIVDHRNWHWNSEGKMDHWMGKIMTIKTKYNRWSYEMVEDSTENGNTGWGWTNEDFARD